MSRKFPGDLPEMSRKFPGNFLEISRNIPGHFQDNSRKIPGHFQESSEKIREMSGKFLGNFLVIVFLRKKGQVTELEGGGGRGGAKIASFPSQLALGDAED